MSSPVDGGGNEPWKPSASKIWRAIRDEPAACDAHTLYSRRLWQIADDATAQQIIELAIQEIVKQIEKRR